MTFPVKRLLNWYYKNKRDLLWRKTENIYRIWLSEVMLQQTQVVTVIPYYERFLKQFPDIQTLAAADEQSVLKLWEGLGYYNRCHNFLKAARLVVSEHSGMVPCQPEEFIKLPGVGPYICAAVMSIALDFPLPVVDGNVLRMITRFYAMRDDISKNPTRKKIETLLSEFIPNKAPGDFNQALMELGATVCTPKNPLCKDCPLKMDCVAKKKGMINSIPYRTPARKIPVHQISVAVIVNENKILIQKRPSTGHLAGMWEFPGGKIEKGETREEALVRECREELGIPVKVIRKLHSVKHAYTHFKIHMHVYICSISKPSIKKMESYVKQPLKWITINDINKYPFPAANHKVFPYLRKLFG